MPREQGPTSQCPSVADDHDPDGASGEYTSGDESGSKRPAETEPKQWRCFHCDEVFTDAAAAAVHFGEYDFHSSDVPGCIEPLRHDEAERLKELRELRAYAVKMQEERNEAEEAADQLSHMRAELGRLFGKCGGSTVSTPHEAWLVLDFEKGRVIAAEERLERIGVILRNWCDSETPEDDADLMCSQALAVIDEIQDVMRSTDAA